MKIFIFLFLILNTSIVFSQNDLNILSNAPTSFKQNKNLNRQSGNLDTLNIEAAFTNDSTMRNREKLSADYITNQKRTFEYGFHKRHDFLWGLFGKSPGTYIFNNYTDSKRFLAVYLRDSLPNRKLKIKELLLRIKSKNPEAPAKVQLYVLPVDISKREIGYNMLDHKVITLSAKSGLKHIDISSENIFMPPGGLLIGIHIIENDLVYLTMSLSHKSNTYLLSFVHKNQVEISRNPINMYEKKSYNLMYGISVVAE